MYCPLMLCKNEIMSGAKGLNTIQKEEKMA
jgi:hypothetical protein